MANNVTNVILCGGSGTRLWPISRTYYPKQFFKMIDGMSLFQITVLRNKNLCDDFIIVTNKDQYFIALDQLDEIGVKNYRFILEPVGRNTAAAITLSCFNDIEKNKNNTVLSENILFVTPSDHLIKNTKNYENVFKFAKKTASEGNIVMFGIKPTYPETGYGYIEIDIKDKDKVISFKEKPDKDIAAVYLESGNFLWNSGMFIFKPEILLDQLKIYDEAIYKASEKAYDNAKKDDMMVRVNEADMLNIKENSIDYALLEKTPLAKVIPSDIGWSDLGSFDAIYDEFKKDESNNAISIGKETLSINSKNNLIMPSGRMIATIDIEDLIIIDTDDALLVSKKGSSQHVKKIVEELKNRKSDLQSHHLTVHRPWGSYTILLESSLYKIKKISVKPGSKLSLQKHFHRSEHWIVTSGTAIVTVDDKKVILRANESTYIPIGSIHRLENPGLIPLVIIEAQVGEYLKEDDIVRVEDDYDRV